MNISHRYEYLYFVIPQCASTTIRNSLAPLTDMGYPVTFSQEYTTAAGFLSEADFNKHLIKEYFKFTFVRNPYDRIYCGYCQERFASENIKWWQTKKKPIFDKIGDDFNKYINEYVQYSDLKSSYEWICFIPMIDFCFVNGKSILDWYGRVESFEDDFLLLKNKLNAPINKIKEHDINEESPPINVKYIGEYESKTIEIINELYKEDFSFFEYDMLNPDDFPKQLSS